MIKKTVIILFCLIVSFTGTTQEEGKALSFSGYLSSLQSSMFDSLSGPFINDYLLHNRLNFRANITEHITFAAEFRNRLFTGDMVRAGKTFSEVTGNDQGWADMSWNILNENSFFLNTTVDRLYLEMQAGKFEVLFGRQRINWGQAFVWNPNDIFNAYSFFDFDYPERPGSDAIRLQYYPSFSSALEIAAKMNGENNVTVAGLWRFNKWSYDIQFLTGYVNSSDFVAGTGWSGNIGSVSFRGEASVFQPLKKSGDNQSTALVTAGFDKILKDNSMIQLQIMYCSNPFELNDFTSLYTWNLSSKDLAFSEFTAFGLFNWAATPLLNMGVSAMWFPDLKGYFAGPTLEYSLAENMDFTVVWQHFNSIIGGSRSNINLGFLRFKYSF
jgi:hypothetical protein